jgi:hypothetical protein
VAVPSREDFLHLGGGLNQGVPPSHLQKEEFSVLTNFYPFGSSLKFRSGVTEESTTEFDEDVTTIFPFQQANGDWILLVASESNIGKLDEGSGAIVEIPVVDRTADPPYFADSRPWIFKQYKDVVYGVRRQNGYPKRITADAVFDAGIAAPDTAPTIADGGAGALAAGSYYAVVTFYNTDTDVESDYSPVSTVATLAADKSLDWTNIPVSDNPQVNARRLYRCTPQATAEDPATYYFVATILDNVTTTYSGDEVIAQDLGTAVGTDNGLPPDTAFLMESWRERCWLWDGETLYFSEFGKFENFGATHSILVYPDDGHEGRALHAFGDRLICGKTRGIHYIVGTDPQNFSLQTLSDKHGCYSHHSMQSAEGILLWYGGDNFYRSDGSDVRAISTFKIKTILEAIPDSRKEYVVATIRPDLSWYIVTVPTDENGGMVTLVYDYKADAWAKFEHAAPATGPNFVIQGFNEEYGQQLYASFPDSGHVYNYLDDTTYQDVGETYTATARSAAFGQQQMGFLRYPKYFYLQSTAVARTFTLNLYRDLSSTAVKTRTSLTLNSARDWKQYSSRCQDFPGALWQWEIVYEGGAALELKAVSVDVLTTRRTVGFAL